MRKFLNNFIQPFELELEQSQAALGLPDGTYRLTLADSATAATRWEIVEAAIEGGQALLDRALEGTEQQLWPAGSVIYCALTAQTANEFAAVIEQGGVKGDPGNSVEMRSTATHIQWREVGTPDWINLISIESLAQATADLLEGRLLPAGGAKDQALVKLSHADYDAGWADRVIPPAPPVLAVALPFGTRLFNTETWDEIQPADQITGAARPAFIREGAALIAANSDAPRLAAYAAPDWSILPGLSAPGQNVSQIEVSEAGGFIVAGLYSSPHMQVYRLSDFAGISLGQSVPTFLSMLAVSPTGDHVAVAVNNSSEVLLYRTSDWTRVPLDAAAVGQVVSTGGGLSFTPDGAELLVMTYTEPQVLRYRAVDGALLASPAVQPSGSGRSLAAHGQHVAATSASSPRLRVYNRSDWSVVSGTPPIAGNPVYSIFSPDGRWLVLCNTSSPWLTVIDTTDWSVVPLAAPPTSATSRPAFSADGTLLAVALDSAPRLQIYNTSDWSLVPTSFGLFATPNGMTFGP